jgi:GH24 family phage-related lysozyme (muramidase)
MVDYTYKLDLDEPVQMGSRFRDQRQGIGVKPTKEEPEADGWADMFYGLLQGYFGDEDEAKKALTTEPEKPSYDMDDALQTLKSVNLPSRISEPVIEGAPMKFSTPKPEPYELEVDTIGNEALDRSGMRLVDVTDTEEGKLSNEEALFEMGKQIREETIKTEGLMSKPSDDSADGVQPTDGKDFETRLEERLVELEGFEAEAYKPDETEEYYTIGYGHYGADVKKGTVLTEAEAREMLRKDIKKRMPKIKKSIKNFDDLSDDLKVEIAQSWFRGGISGSPETIKLINEGKFTEAAAEFLDNEEYRTTKLGGVKTRMEALSNALKAEAA